MAKSRKTRASTDKIAGFTAAEWKQHMNTDEDWTERLEGASETTVREAVDALAHADATVRGLACNLVYAIGVPALGDHAADAVDRLASLADSDRNAKVRNRARVVHEGLAGELDRVRIRRELPWLAAYDESALPHAVAALDDKREAVRMQVYLWWANAGTIDDGTRTKVATKLAAQADRETEEITRRAAQIALATVRGEA